MPSSNNIKYIQVIRANIVKKVLCKRWKKTGKLKIIQIQSINQNMNSDYKSAWL